MQKSQKMNTYVKTSVAIFLICIFILIFLILILIGIIVVLSLQVFKFWTVIRPTPPIDSPNKKILKGKVHAPWSYA